MPKVDVLIIGAGLAGLTCARCLQNSNVEFLLLEASDAPGGRVRTDLVEGFRLDRGFQIFLTAYPEPRRWLNYDALNLRSFYPGAKVWFGGEFHRLADPFRRPLEALGSVFNPIGTVADKLRVAAVRHRASSGPLEGLFQRPESSTLDYLEHQGFSSKMIEHFFRPFLSGIMLDRTLTTSSRVFEFIFRMFAQGRSTVPADGMGQIPLQLAAALPKGALRCHSRVSNLDGQRIRLASGEEWEAQAVVVATDGPNAEQLMGWNATVGSRAVQCRYYAGAATRNREPILHLDGTGSLPFNSVVFMSAVAPRLAPSGHTLISATTLGPHAPDEFRARQQLRDWFGAEVEDWRLLATYLIPHAQPDFNQLHLPSQIPEPRVREGVYICGDHQWTASINGAMESGRHAAEAIIRDFGRLEPAMLSSGNR